MAEHDTPAKRPSEASLTEEEQAAKRLKCEGGTGDAATTEAAAHSANEAAAAMVVKCDGGSDKAAQNGSGLNRSEELKRQVEWYFSDKNLSMDSFFHSKMTADPDQWLDMKLLLSCPKMKALGATADEVIAALQTSTLEVRKGDEASGLTAAVRRTTPLPALLRRSASGAMGKGVAHGKKHMDPAKAHSGGIVMVVSGIPEEISWQEIKGAVRESILPQKGAVWFASEIKAATSECVLVLAPFPGDLEFVEKMQLTLGGKDLKITIPQGAELVKRVDSLPEYVTKRRSKKAQSVRKEQEKNKKPIRIGKECFSSSNLLRSRVRTLIASYPDGKVLTPECSDYNLALGVLQHHPRASEKLAGMKAIKINPREVGETVSRCFWIVYDDGREEDISYAKCIVAIECKHNLECVKAAADQVAAEAAKVVTEQSTPTNASASVTEDVGESSTADNTPQKATEGSSAAASLKKGEAVAQETSASSGSPAAM